MEYGEWCTRTFILLSQSFVKETFKYSYTEIIIWLVLWREFKDMVSLDKFLDEENVMKLAGKFTSQYSLLSEEQSGLLLE